MVLSRDQKGFWIKKENNIWEKSDERTALEQKGSPHYYGIGMFVLQKIS